MHIYVRVRTHTHMQDKEGNVSQGKADTPSRLAGLGLHQTQPPGLTHHANIHTHSPTHTPHILLEFSNCSCQVHPYFMSRKPPLRHSASWENYLTNTIGGLFNIVLKTTRLFWCYESTSMCCQCCGTLVPQGQCGSPQRGKLDKRDRMTLCPLILGLSYKQPTWDAWTTSIISALGV